MCSTSSRLARSSPTSVSNRASEPGRSGNRGEHYEPPPRLALVATRHLAQQARVDVAARQHYDRGALLSRRQPPREERGHPDRAGALDNQLRPLEQEHHRFGDLVLFHAHQLVDPASDQRQRELPRALDRDPVGDRQRRGDRDRSPGGERARHRGAAGHLDPGDLDLLACGLDRDRDAADQTAPAHRHDHPRQVRDLREQLESERSLSGDHVPVLERVHERHSLILGGQGVSGFERVVDRGTDHPHVRAQRFGRLDLGDRGRLGHEHDTAEAARAGGVGHRLGVVAGAARDHPVGTGIAQGRELVQRAAKLERPGALEVLGLEDHSPADALGERPRAQHRRLLHHTGHRLSGPAEILGRDGGGLRRVSQGSPPRRRSRRAPRAAGPPPRSPPAPADPTRRRIRTPR